MPKTLRAAAAGSCRTSAVTPLSSRLSQWASAAGLVPTGLCACFEFGLGGGEFGSHLLSGHGDLALVPVDGGCLALRAGPASGPVAQGCHRDSRCRHDLSRDATFAGDQ